MRVFVSSTGADLMDHREALIDAILRRDWQVVAMEHFGADPRKNLQMCRDKVATCDAIVLVVAHRYGSPVPKIEGGDGEHSYTWYEVLEAEERKIERFGYIVADDAPWTAPKEGDLLRGDMSDEELRGVRARIQRLDELKLRLQSSSVGRFTTPDDLAKQAITDLSRHADAPGRPSAPAPRTWQPRHEHALQPALHFAGREDLMRALSAWWRDAATPDRVVALVAPGGTGKTAIAQALLTQEGAPPGHAGLFVWSFYEAPQVERFLGAAAAYFTGAVVETAGALEALKAGLRGTTPHVLVLDGLERVQAEGQGSRPRGELADTQLRTLVRLAAAGHLGRARLLVTTRFPMADLGPWRDAGYRAHELTDLDPAAARALLQQWGVTGTADQLDALADRVGRHALSVAVLGSFVGTYSGGDPAAADELDLGQAGDSASGRLGRLLVYYRERLTDAECQVMSWLATFHRGVRMQLLVSLAGAGEPIAGAVAGWGEPRLRQALEGLCALGLVFAFDEGDEVTYSAHPFVRDTFRLLDQSERQSMFDVVRRELSAGLETRPGTKPTDPAVLDRYEALVEATREAGAIEAAYRLFRDALDGYAYLGKCLGEYARGLRVLDGFTAGTPPARVACGLPEELHATLISDLGLFRCAMGDLDGALTCHRQLVETTTRNQARTMSFDSCIHMLNLTDVLVLSSLLSAAEQAATQAVALARDGLPAWDWRGPYPRRWWEVCTLHELALVRSLRGDHTAAQQAFAQAMELVDFHDLPVLGRVLEAEHYHRLDHLAPMATFRATLAAYEAAGQGRDVALCNDVLARCHLPDDPDTAAPHLAELRDWATRTGEVEMVLRAHRTASELALAQDDPSSALAEADEGIALADALGYGLMSIDLRVAGARAALALPDPRRALTLARQALDRAAAPECGYAWGEADGAVLCARAHAELDQPDLARRRYAEALEVQRRIEHPRVADTEAALARLGA